MPAHNDRDTATNQSDPSKARISEGNSILDRMRDDFNNNSLMMLSPEQDEAVESGINKAKSALLHSGNPGGSADSHSKHTAKPDTSSSAAPNGDEWAMVGEQDFRQH